MANTIPDFPITRLEHYLAAICEAMGIEPTPAGGDSMKVLYLEESNNVMGVRTGDGYATFEEFIDNLGAEEGEYIPAVVNGKVALEVQETRAGYYNFVTFDGIGGTESGFAANLASYEVNSVPVTGYYPMTYTGYTWELAQVE